MKPGIRRVTNKASSRQKHRSEAALMHAVKSRLPSSVRSCVCVFPRSIVLLLYVWVVNFYSGSLLGVGRLERREPGTG